MRAGAWFEVRELNYYWRCGASYVYALFLRLKAYIYRFVFGWACQGPFDCIPRKMIWARNWRPLEISSLNDTPGIILEQGTQYHVEAPRWLGKTPLVWSGIYPPILAHVFNGALATAYSPAVIQADKVYIPQQVFEERVRILTDSAGLFQMGRRFLVGRIGAESTFPCGILIGGAGAFNWYHFIIECLPKAFLARKLPSEFDDFPLLVPQECRTVSSFADALDIIAAGRTVRYMKRGEVALVNRLVVLDEISIGPYNLVEGEWPCIDDYRQHDAVMLSYIAELRDKVLSSTSCLSSGRRIFLRRPGERRDYNQDELIDIAVRYGFETVELPLLSLEEQAKVFAEASAVIGPSGAAWVGMIFRDRPMVGLSWLPKPYEEFCGYSALAHLLGHEIDFIEARTRDVLKSTGEAYRAAYRICTIEFEIAVQKLTQKLESNH